MAVVATTLSLLWEPRTLPSSGLISRVAVAKVSTVEPICFPRYRGDNNVHLFGTDRMCFHAAFLLGLVSDPEDGGDILLRNLC
jgi:hypothetical protein